MSTTVAHLIYGVPLLDGVIDFLLAREIDDEEAHLQKMGFDVVTTQTGALTGWCGVRYGYLSEALEPVPSPAPVLSDAMRQEAERRVETLPLNVRALLPGLGEWVVWSIE